MKSGVNTGINLELLLDPNMQLEVIKEMPEDKRDCWMEMFNFSLSSRAAVNGDLAELKRTLKITDFKKLETDEELFDDVANIMYIATLFHRQNIVDYFLDNGLSAHYCIFDVGNLVTLAKGHSKHNDFSRYLKNRIGLDSNRLEKLSDEFDFIIKKEYQVAQENNKKILILVGETHCAFKTQQIEKRMLKVVNELGIATYLFEAPNDEMQAALASGSKYYHTASRYAFNLGMSMAGIDNKHSRGVDGVCIDKRNKAMAAELSKIKENAIFVTGLAHMKGLLEIIDKNLFHVVPFSLAMDKKPAIFEQRIIERDENYLQHKQFFIDPCNVILLEDDHFSEYQTVCTKWNQSNATKNPEAQEQAFSRDDRKRFREEDNISSSKRSKTTPKSITHARMLRALEAKKRLKEKGVDAIKKDILKQRCTNS